jgi:NitT/TauT family transport system permease protein
MSAKRTQLPPRLQSVLLGMAGVTLAIFTWQIAAVTVNNSFVLPRFDGVAVDMWQLVADPTQRLHFSDTLGRVAVGFSIGSLIGLVLGGLIGAFRVIREVVNPYLNFLRSVAPIAWLVPATIWFGVGDPSILFVVIYAAAFPVAINAISGMAAVPPNKIRMARMFGLSRLGVFVKILVPNAVPFVLTGCRLGLGLSFMAVVGTEMVIGQTGLGYLVYEARVFYETEIMFAGIIVLGLVGLVGDLVFVAGKNKVFARYYTGKVAA